MTLRRILPVLSMTFLACLPVGPLLAESTAEQPIPAAWRELSPTGPWVVQLGIDQPSAVQRLSQQIDVLSVDPAARELTALVSGDDLRRLVDQGFVPTLDAEQTRIFGRLGIPLENQGSGIPGFPCFRTVEETFATAEAIVSAHPDLATWIDVGDSWEKTVDANSGWDIFVLKLTQSSIPGDKPVFFASFAIHAREYAPGELGTRFAEYLVDNYGTDPDVTWLLDHHEVHLMLQANPDGRKRAETGILWRKNTNNDYCSNSNSRGADLNRNFEYQWNCCGGSSGQQCSDVFRGPTAASEPEIQVLQAYLQSVFPDQRGPDPSDPAPADATGVAIDVHSAGGLVIWPWGFTAVDTPNATAFATLGRKLAFFNNYQPLKISQFTIADGSSADFFYGDLGVAGMGYEIGDTFFESCSNFENNIVGVNIASLLFGAKVARTPYLTAAGPEAFDATALPSMVSAGDFVLLSATLDDTRFNNSNGAEPTQTIASAEAFIDVPPWADGATPLAMVAADGTFDEGSETVEVTIDTSGLAPGRHMLFVRGTDTAGSTGIVAAAFLDVVGEATIFDDGFESGDLSAWSSSLP